MGVMRFWSASSLTGAPGAEKLTRITETLLLGRAGGRSHETKRTNSFPDRHESPRSLSCTFRDQGS